MERKYYLGFDAGTQSVKVAVYDENMQEIVMSTAKTTLSYPQPGWVQMDVDEYYRLIKQCMRICSDGMKKKGLSPFGKMGHHGRMALSVLSCIDENGKSSTLYINYLDSRTAEDVAQLKEQHRDIKQGKRAMPNRMSCSRLCLPAGFCRMCRTREKGVKFVHNCPYILMHLAGLSGSDAFIDWGTMSGWGLGYDVVKKCWSEEQLRILGIPRSYMPRIVKPWDIIGHLCEADAAETGFPAGIPICAGAGDTMESMMGSGILEAGRADDVAGTCAMFCAATDGIIPELSARTGLVFNSGNSARYVVFLLGHGADRRTGPALVQG